VVCPVQRHFPNVRSNANHRSLSTLHEYSLEKTESPEQMEQMNAFGYAANKYGVELLLRPNCCLEPTWISPGASWVTLFGIRQSISHHGYPFVLHLEWMASRIGTCRPPSRSRLCFAASHPTTPPTTTPPRDAILL
jgi:hypothetical protein